MLSPTEFTQNKNLQGGESMKSVSCSETCARVPLTAYYSNLSCTNVQWCLSACEEETNELLQRERQLKLSMQEETETSTPSTRTITITPYQSTQNQEKTTSESSAYSPILTEQPIVASKLRELLSPFVISSEAESYVNSTNFEQADEQNVHVVKDNSKSVPENEHDVFDTPELHYHADRLFLRILGSEVKKKINVKEENEKKTNSTRETNFLPLLKPEESSSKKIKWLFCTEESSPLQSESEYAHIESEQKEERTCDEEQYKSNFEDKEYENVHENSNHNIRFDLLHCCEYEEEELLEEEEELLSENEKLAVILKTICRTMQDKRVDVYTGEEYLTNITEIDELDCETECGENTNKNNNNNISSDTVAPRSSVTQYPVNINHNVNILTDFEEQEKRQRCCQCKRACNPLSDDSMLNEAIAENVNNSLIKVMEIDHNKRENSSVIDNKVSNSVMEIECVYAWETFPSLLPVHESKKDMNVSKSKACFHDNIDNVLYCCTGCNKVCESQCNEHEEYPLQIGAAVESRSSSNSLSATSERSGLWYNTSTDEEMKVMNVCSDGTPILTCNSGFRLPHTHDKSEEEHTEEELYVNNIVHNVKSKQSNELVNECKHASNEANVDAVMCSVDVICVQDCNVKVPIEEKVNE